MASITSDDETSEANSSISSLNSYYSRWSFDEPRNEPAEKNSETEKVPPLHSATNVVINLQNRERYGRFARGPNAKFKTEPVFPQTHKSCRYALSSLLRDAQSLYHIYMGFTLCGQYFLSYTQKERNVAYETDSLLLQVTYEYELYIWRFVPGVKLQYVSKHKIFSHLKGPYQLDRIMIMQFPNDMHKIICYGYAEINDPEVFHISIITLPSKTNCVHCQGALPTAGESLQRGWCPKHGFEVHYMLSTSQPAPTFDPKISLSFPNHLVINTGYYIHVLNITTSDAVRSDPWIKEILNKTQAHQNLSNSISNDTFSDISESASDNFGCNSVVDAILEDFSEYDLDSAEATKPFHELNISCEPLNVTGKSYHNTLVQNIFDPRIKRLQSNVKDYVFSVPHASTQRPPEKNKTVDKKVAEKEYEFTEENEKYEKISLFRKKRLADKKYEFSEDNTENIVPLHILRRERRFLYRSQSRSIRSPELNSLFVSPRSPGWRSPMQSPSSRHGQLSPSGARHIYCTSVRNSPYHSKSPISPRDLARKVSVYSPSIDGDCSDSESRLILKTAGNFSASHFNGDSRSGQSGLLEPKREQSRWIKKIVRRYSSGDFENSSLLSGQSRDDFSNPIEIPSIVQGLTEQPFDATERQIIVSQRSMDCEQFVQRLAQALCCQSNMQFMYCEDYDIRILCVCPLNGDILCHAVIKLGAFKKAAKEQLSKADHYWANFLFVWSITTDAFDVVEPESIRLFPCDKVVLPAPFESSQIPQYHCNDVWVLSYDISQSSQTVLRDYKSNFEICLGSRYEQRYSIWSSIHSESDAE